MNLIIEFMKYPIIKQRKIIKNNLILISGPNIKSILITSLLNMENTTR